MNEESQKTDLYELARRTVEDTLNSPLERAYPYAYVDGICLKRSWSGSYNNVAVVVAVSAYDDGCRKAIERAKGSSSPSSVGASSSHG